MKDVTCTFSAIEHGDAHAAEQLLPLVYDELRKIAAAKLAQEKPGQTLQATALVHEAYVRLVEVDEAQQWNSRGHFFAAAAEAMRRILVEKARRKQADKHGGGRLRVDLPEDLAAAEARSDDLVAAGRGAEPAGTPRSRRGPAREATLLCRPVAPGRGRGPGHQPRRRRPPVGAGPGLAVPPIVEIVDCSHYFCADRPDFSH